MKEIWKVLAVFLLILFAGCAQMGVAPGPGDMGGDALTPEERLRLGAIYESKGEEDLALREYKKVSEEDRSNANAYFALANLYLKMEKYGEAEANYKKAIEINPNEATYLNNLGWLYMERGELDRAVEEVTGAISKDPKRKYIYLDTLGVIQTRQGRFTEAEASLTEAAELTPMEEAEGLRYIYTHFIELYTRSGDTAKASAAREKLDALKSLGDWK